MRSLDIHPFGSPVLLALLVQPDLAVSTPIAIALAAEGHEVVVVSVASWAIRLVRERPPDVVLLEQTAPGFEHLVDAIDDLDVDVPVLVTRFSEVAQQYRSLDRAQAAALVQRVERVALRHSI